MTGATVLELVRRLRETSDAPIIFYTYYNLVFANGVDAYVRAAKAAGVDGILTLDLPPEEAGEVSAACAHHGMDTVFIVAPTTPDSKPRGAPPCGVRPPGMASTTPVSCSRNDR
jgi:tryptophan synthase alpha chain